MIRTPMVFILSHRAPNWTAKLDFGMQRLRQSCMFTLNAFSLFGVLSQFYLNLWHDLRLISEIRWWAYCNIESKKEQMYYVFAKGTFVSTNALRSISFTQSLEGSLPVLQSTIIFEADVDKVDACRSFLPENFAKMGDFFTLLLSFLHSSFHWFLEGVEYWAILAASASHRLNWSISSLSAKSTFCNDFYFAFAMYHYL